MFELIALIALIGSLAGMTVILVQKIPVLKELKVPPKAQQDLLLTLQQKIKESRVLKLAKLLKSGFRNIFLQKALSKIKVVSLKIEARSSRSLEKMREGTRKRKENEKYWDKVVKKPSSKTRKKAKSRGSSIVK